MPRAWTLALTLLVVSVGFSGLAESAAVTTDPVKLDLPLVGAASAQVNGKVYLFGGRDTSDTYTSAIRMYDPAAQTVTTVANFPTPVGGPTVGGTAGRYSGTAVAFGGKIYFFGGTQIVQIDINADGDPEPVPRAVRDIFEFDPATNNLKHLSDRLPLGTWGMSGVATGSSIYLFGGFTFDYGDLPNTGRHDWVLRFDPNQPEGSRLRELSTKLPYKVQDAAAAMIGRRIYVMGGLSDHNAEVNPCPTYTTQNDQGQQETTQIEVCITKRIIMIDPTFNQEFALGVAGDLPYRAQFIGAGVAGGKAYIAGGLLGDQSAAASIVEISVNAAGTPSSRVITPALPGPSFGQAVSSDGKTISIIGGRFGASRELYDAILRLDPGPTPPWAPRSATAVDITGGVRLTWEPPTYNGDAAITGYRVYRTPLDGAEEKLTETTSLSFDDTTVRPGTEYVWRISAVNTAGESNQSARVTRASEITVPGVVAYFSAIPGNNEANLRWDPPAETGGTNLTGYRVIRNGQIIASPGASVRNYVDRTAVNGQTYTYQVRASNVKGDGPASHTETITPADIPPAPTDFRAEVIAAETASSVRLTWTPPPAAVQKFIVLRSTLPLRAVPIANLSATDTSYVDTTAQKGRTYYYSVASANQEGFTPSAEEQVALVRKPGAPGDVSAVGLDGEVRISWSPPVDTGDAPASSLRYYVSRQGGGSSRETIIKTDIETTSYIDRLVTAGQPYTYTVTTLNPVASDPSAPATATPKIIQNKPPVALLSILPPIANAGDPVELDASQSSDIDGAIRTYSFNFGDGTDPVTTTQPTVSHQYARNGTYLATLVVTDNRNELSEPASAQIIVGETVSREIDTGLPGQPPTPDNTEPPGSETPGVPGPHPAHLLAALALAALVLRRRHPAR